MAFVRQQVNDFLGQGLTLPLRIENGRWPIDSGVKMIRESIKMILRWQIGTRPFLNEFGSNLERLLEEPNDDVLKQTIYAFTADALSKWEKRVEVLDCQIDRPEFNSVNCNITYKIITSQKTDTFVFPFYSQITS